jgi:iron complex outermembrane receptor protein
MFQNNQSPADRRTDQPRRGPTASRLLQGGSLAVLALCAASPALAQASAQSQAAAASKIDQVEEVIVTGTSIRGVAPTGSALVSVTRDQIVAIGAQTTQDIVRSIPALGAFGQVLTPSADFGQVGIKPSIHNIGAGATLTLVNGHRMVGAGILQTNADPSVIPPSAIQRIEVIADGASSIYGSDAVAGVINVILRKNFDGAETSARYGVADNYWTYDLNQVFGRKWDGGSFMIAGEYTKNSAIFGRQRDFVRQDQRPIGYNDLRSTAAIPPNITAGGATYAYPGFSTTPNLYDTSQVGSLIPKASRFSVFSTANQQITPNIELYADAFYSKRKSTNFVDPGGQTPTFTTANPYFMPVPGVAATSEIVRFNMLPLVGVLHTPSNLEGMGLTTGVNFDVGHDWRVVLEGNLGHEDDHNDQQVVNATNFAKAVAATTTDTALDPFLGRTNPAVLAGLIAHNDARNVQELREVSLKADGPLFALPAGQVKLAAGLQYHYESLEQTYRTVGVVGSLKSALHRDFVSQFAEVLVPVFGGDFSWPGLRRLDLSASIRHDRYSDVGSTTNPKVGANWTPFEDLNFHASYGTSFRAPSLADKNPASIDTRVQPLFASTQFAPPGAPPSNYFYLAGSDSGLTPEEGKTWSVGGDYSPPFIPGLKVGATWWRVKYSNIISIAFPPALYTDASLAQFYTNNPTDAQIAAFVGNLRVDGLAATDTASKVAYLHGATRMIDLRRKNLGILDASGIDFDLRYQKPIGPGSVSLSWTSTVMQDWKTKVSPTAAEVDNFPNGTQIRWRSRTTAGWQASNYSLQAAYNYVGGYTNLGVAAQPKVKPYETIDLAGSYDLPTTGLLSGIQLTANIDNVADKDPPIRFTGNGYSTISNPLGRTFAVGLRKTW